MLFQTSLQLHDVHVTYYPHSTQEKTDSKPFSKATWLVIARAGISAQSLPLIALLSDFSGVA